MGSKWLSIRGLAGAALLVVLCLTGGCQLGEQVSVRRLINHQAMIDFSELKAAEHHAAVKAALAIPSQWYSLDPKRSSFYTDMQWRSPSGESGIGVVHVRMPLPLSAHMLLWMAKSQYLKRDTSGKLMDEWTDSLGRLWFEGENHKYHIRGYVITRGLDAWVSYLGYRREFPPNAVELRLAAKSLESVVPRTR